jgi:hypothetical protein
VLVPAAFCGTFRAHQADAPPLSYAQTPRASCSEREREQRLQGEQRLATAMQIARRAVIKVAPYAAQALVSMAAYSVGLTATQVKNGATCHGALIAQQRALTGNRLLSCQPV